MRWPWRAVVSLVMVIWAACASLRPDFEQDFQGQDRTTHDAWFGLLRTRYGCDTVLVRGARTSATGSMVSGTGVCVAAAFVTPLRIRGWRQDSSLREDWEFTGTVGLRAAPVSISGGTIAYAGMRGRCVLALQGEHERDLRVLTLRC